MAPEFSQHGASLLFVFLGLADLWYSLESSPRSIGRPRHRLLSHLQHNMLTLVFSEFWVETMMWQWLDATKFKKIIEHYCFKNFVYQTTKYVHNYTLHVEIMGNYLVCTYPDYMLAISCLNLGLNVRILFVPYLQFVIEEFVVTELLLDFPNFSFVFP